MLFPAHLIFCGDSDPDADAFEFWLLGHCPLLKRWHSLGNVDSMLLSWIPSGEGFG